MKPPLGETPEEITSLYSKPVIEDPIKDIELDNADTTSASAIETGALLFSEKEVIETLFRRDNIYNVHKYIEVEPRLVEFVVNAAATVWMAEAAYPHAHVHDIVFADYLFEPNGERSLSEGCYTDGKIQIACRRIKETWPDFDFDLAVEMIAGHEARHEAQHANGEKLKRSREYFDAGDNQGYLDDPQEIQARESGMHVLKAHYDDVEGTFTLGNQVYEIPEHSKYTYISD